MVGPPLAAVAVKLPPTLPPATKISLAWSACRFPPIDAPPPESPSIKVAPMPTVTLPRITSELLILHVAPVGTVTS